MPRRDDLHTILIIGSGPIVIGQACEFDYSGTQACKALREDGYRVVLVNSNPATIMTDPGTADRTYIEPLTREVLERVIEAEKPDAVLPTLGGQTALNLAMDLDRHGVLARHGVEMNGAKAAAIRRGLEESAAHGVTAVGEIATTSDFAAYRGTGPRVRVCRESLGLSPAGRPRPFKGSLRHQSGPSASISAVWARRWAISAASRSGSFAARSFFSSRSSARSKSSGFSSDSSTTIFQSSSRYATFPPHRQ